MQMPRHSRSGNPARRAQEEGRVSRPVRNYDSVTAFTAADLASSSGAVKVILDNNIWCHLADGHISADELEGALRTACAGVPCRIVASPAVLNEMLDSDHEPSRARAVALISDPRWLRATRDIELWVAELVKAADGEPSLRHWVRNPPDLRELAPHIRQWRDGIWTDSESVRLDPTFVAHRPNINANHLAEKDASRFTKPGRVPNLGSLRLQESTNYIAGTPFWRIEDPIELWRLWGWSTWVNDLTRRGSTARVVADAYLRVEQILGSDLGDFLAWWTLKLAPSQVRRTWLYWATQTVQAYHRGPDRGDSFDRTHATYLVDCDLLLTCDQAFGRVLIEVAKQAPFPTGRPVTVPATPFQTLPERIGAAVAVYLEALAV